MILFDAASEVVLAGARPALHRFTVGGSAVGELVAVVVDAVEAAVVHRAFAHAAVEASVGAAGIGPKASLSGSAIGFSGVGPGRAVSRLTDLRRAAELRSRTVLVGLARRSDDHGETRVGQQQRAQHRPHSHNDA